MIVNTGRTCDDGLSSSFVVIKRIQTPDEMGREQVLTSTEPYHIILNIHCHHAKYRGIVFTMKWKKETIK